MADHFFLSALTSCFGDEIKIAILLERDLYFLVFGHPCSSGLSSAVYHASASAESDCNHVKLIKRMFLPRPRLMWIKKSHRKSAHPIADEQEQT